MTIGDVERRGAKLDAVRLAFTEFETLTGGDVLAKLRRLIKIRDHRRHVTISEVGRLHKGVFVQVGAVLVLRVEVRVQQRLSRNVAATRRSRARHSLAATADADGRPALITMNRRNAPSTDKSVESRMHIGA